MAPLNKKGDIVHIVMTAGGTSEPIDGVRKISNTSTGSLSACIYEALADYIGAHAAELGAGTGEAPAFLVHYVVSATAVRPEARGDLPIVFYPVTDVKSTEVALEALLTEHKVSYVIHAMAVSDFTRGYLIEREVLADELAAAAAKCSAGGQEALRETIARVLAHPAGALRPEAKVGSGSELMLSLVKTPKLIGKIKQWDPSVFLVGFKLLKNVSEEELVRVASELAEKNGCDLVLANDVSRIDADRHFGLLVQNGRVADRFQTKREIAAGIAAHMLAGRRRNEG